MSVLRGRYSGSPETAFDFDIRQIEARGLVAYAEVRIENELPDSFWTGMLPQLMDTSSSRAPTSCLPGGAGQARRQGLPVARHHRARPASESERRAPRLPQEASQEAGPHAGRYNQIANFVLAQSEINIAIGDKPPEVYFASWPSSATAARRSTAASPTRRAARQPRASCLPESMLDGEIPNYDDFLEERRKLMALKIKAWFEAL
jgi:hypothetical protein